MKRKPEAGSQCEYATRSSRGLAARLSMSWQPVHSGLLPSSKETKLGSLCPGTDVLPRFRQLIRTLDRAQR